MKIILGLAAGLAAALFAVGAVFGIGHRNSQIDRQVLVPGPVTPLQSGDSASTGKITLTFDDGPGPTTKALLTEMGKLHLRGVFFVVGSAASGRPDLIREEVAAGNLIENHTWSHRSFTGASTHSKPLTSNQVRTELVRGEQAIVAAGAPMPTMYRPPYGDVSASDEKVAASLHLKMVGAFSLASSGRIIDSRDWAGQTSAQIAHTVTSNLRPGSVVVFHDGTDVKATENTIRALQAIVKHMNTHHLGITTSLRPPVT